ncbi:TetR/AcrR family transcriptional regulator C-terminal domain-containing protein [Planococcus sp. SIMBA_160]
MSGNPTDLRVVRTKQAIRAALIALIEQKGFEAISVKDITGQANINRGTFYSHYEDKYDLMDKCQEQLLKEMETKIVPNIPKLIEETKKHEAGPMPIAVLMPFFEFLHANQSFMKALLGPKGDAAFQVKMKECLNRGMFGPENAIFTADGLLVPPRYLASYIASAHIGVIQEWLNGGAIEPPEEIARIISAMTIHGPLFAAGIRKKQ